MSPETLALLSAALPVLALGVAVLASVAALRGARENRRAAERAEQAQARAVQMQEARLSEKEDALAGLHEEVSFLRELESVRFAERYLETKNGLELRLKSLENQQERWSERGRELQRELEELSLSREQKSGEMARLRGELARTQLDGRTLEDALRAVSSLGEIPMTDLREALTKVRRRQTEITTRLDQLGLEGEEKTSERSRLQLEIERARGEVARLRREIEITRAAGPLLDGLLGVSAEMQKKMVRIEDQLERSLRSLDSVRGQDSFAGFIEAATGAVDPGLLPVPGTPRTPAAAAPASSPAAQPDHRADTPAAATAA